MSKNIETKPLTDENVSEIDKALASAKAKQAARKGAGVNADAVATTAKAPKAEKPAKEAKRPRLSDEEKAARASAKETALAEKKAARAVAREAKKAERSASKSPAHMAKVSKAAEKLSTMSEAAQLIFNDATANLSAANVANLAAHLQHFNRVKATERALNQNIEVGQTVTIVGGDPRFIGQTGTITKSQRIRCYCEVTGARKPIYLYTSDVELVKEAASSDVAVAS